MIRSHGVTDIGCVREINEDRILVDESLGLYIVADDMGGGHSHGDMAAELDKASGAKGQRLESSRAYHSSLPDNPGVNLFEPLSWPRVQI